MIIITTIFYYIFAITISTTTVASPSAATTQTAHHLHHLCYVWTTAATSTATQSAHPAETPRARYAEAEPARRGDRPSIRGKLVQHPARRLQTYAPTLFRHLWGGDDQGLAPYDIG